MTRCGAAIARAPTSAVELGLSSAGGLTACSFYAAPLCSRYSSLTAPHPHAVAQVLAVQQDLQKQRAGIL